MSLAAGAIAVSGTGLLSKPEGRREAVSLRPPLSSEISDRVDEIKGELMAQRQGETIRYTSCSGSQCWKYCAVQVRVKEGVITGFEPDQSINPLMTREDEYLSDEAMRKLMVQSRGCPMLYANKQMLYDPNRVLYPLLRVGERGEGKFVRITLDKAIDLLASWLQEIKDTYGPHSIWHDSYTCIFQTSFPLAPWFHAGVAAWDCHSGNGWAQPTKWVVGGSDGSQDPSNIFDAKLIVLWGYNPTSTAMGEWPYYIALAREKGIPVICIDPNKSWSAEVLADQWIPIRYGTDVVMVMAMANVLLKEGLFDEDFVELFVEPFGFNMWRAYVLGEEDGVDKTPEWAEEICGVPAETIREFARLYAASKPVNLNCSYATGRQIFGENNARALMYLQAMTGNIGLPGATAAAGTAGSPGARHGSGPTANWGRPEPEYYAPTMMAAMYWHRSIVYRELVDSWRMTKREYNGLIGNVATNPMPNLKMAINENNALLTSFNANKAIKAAGMLKYTVAFSQEVERPTARFADLIIPQNYVMFESRSPYMPFRNYHLFRWGRGPGNFFLFMQKCVDPPGEVRPHDWVWLEVAKRLGIAEKYHPRLADVSWENWDDAVDEIHKEAYEQWASRPEIAIQNPPTWEEFQEHPIWRYPADPPYYQYKGLQEGTKTFGTDSGKVEFWSELLAKGPEWLTNHDYYPVGWGVSYGPGNLAPMAKWQHEAGDHFYSPDTKKWPILVHTPHSYYREHTFRDNNPMLRDECYRHAIWLSVPDAKARGIKDNDQVRVYNEIGEMIIPAHVTSRVTPGSALLWETAWYEPCDTKTELMPYGIDRRGSCNFICRDIDIPYTVVGHYNCKGLAEVEKF
jgi:anaerobic dimethyl sulfoxide reductase subunit A